MENYVAYYSSPVGWLQIRCSESHLREVLFMGHVPDEGGEDHPILVETIRQLDEYFSGKRKVFELPLGQEGTVFQSKVWDLLCTIPFGKTISYNELAKKYGDLKAIRAVASANGKNNLAIIVPCHRVIGSNQTLVGYAGGLHRKRWLLEHEAKHSGVLTMF